MVAYATNIGCEREIVSQNHLDLEIQLIINQNLHNNCVISTEMYELVAENLLKQIALEVNKK